MDYEKKYKEALERAKELLNKQGITVGSYPNREAIETIFPELRESEDERIREWLVYYFKAIGKSWLHHRDISIEQILAYLEKQKEPHKRLRDKTPWIVTAKEELAHDEERLQANLEELHRIRAEKEKQKVQKPAEWSEEDEKIMDSIINELGQHYKTCTSRDCPSASFSFKAYQKEIDWLKSLRPSWKPSEEQMSALLAVLNDPDNIGSQTCQLAITELYEQLKKL